MYKYPLETTSKFNRLFKKFTRKDKKLSEAVISTLENLQIDPFQKKLETHKADTVEFGRRYSSRITGDLRVIWDFVDDNTVILTLTIGGHSGGKKVYK